MTDRAHPDRLEGRDRIAVRRPESATWLLVEREHLFDGELPLGVRIELDREDHGRHDTASSQRALPGVGRPLAPPALGLHATWVLVGLLGIAAAWAVVAGLGRPTFAVSGGVRDFPTLVGALALLYGTFNALRVLEGALLADALKTSGAWVRLRRGLVQIEPVAWRLAVPSARALGLLATAGGLFLVATSLIAIAPAVGVGVGVGSLLYVLQALHPLRPSPGTSLLEAAVGVRDLPAQLRWTLLSRFVPVPSRLEVRGSSAMGVSGLAFAAWVACAIAALAALAAPPTDGATPAGKLWEVTFTLLLVGYGAWLAILTLRLFLSAIQLRAGAALKPLRESEASASAWREHNPVLRHLPELSGAEWRWGTAPRGAVLIRQGSDDHRFLWLVSGRANVLGRSEGGDPVLIAELQAGSGVGELALLRDEARTADVIASEDCVVAVLEKDEFERVADDGTRGRLQQLALASQALARSHELWGLYADDRARWLALGEPRVVAEGEVLIRQGDDARWMGLVAAGSLDVARDGETVGTLSADEVFGEMAYLDGTPRSATLTATAETLVWTWGAAFLDRAVGSGEVRDALRRLAGERAV